MVRSTILFYTWFNVQLRPRSRTVTLGLPEIWVVTAMLMYIPVLRVMIPCRSVRINQSINQSFRETYCFTLLHLGMPKNRRCIYIDFSSVATARLKHKKQC
jgi:hypothetical protein